MCKRDSYAPATRLAGEGAYDGQTTRLSLGERAWDIRGKATHGWSFPWWALWLIWPLIALTKWATPLVLSALAAVTGSLGVLGAQLTATILIFAGVALLRRAR